MQAEDLLALSNYRRNGSSTLRYSPHKHSGLSAEFEGGRQVIFHPLGKFRVVWDLCGLCLLLADSILLPLSLAWGWQQGTKNTGEIFLLTVFLLSLAFWSLDIVTNLNTAFYLRGHLVLSRWLIVRHYLQTWFIIDAAVVSLDYVTLVNFIQEAEESSFGIVRFIRAARAFRLVRLLKMARFDDLMQEIAASTGRQWIMLVVAIINSTEVFVAGALSTCMYITATGEYTLVEGYDLSIEPKYLKGVNRLEELALYVDALAHQSSLIATTFAEM
eukprot:g20663.t1